MKTGDTVRVLFDGVVKSTAESGSGRKWLWVQIDGPDEKPVLALVPESHAQQTG